MVDFGSGQYGITVIESTDDDNCAQTGDCLPIENASNGFQTSAMKVADNGYLDDVFLYWQLTTHDDSQVANTGGGTDDVIPDMHFEDFNFYLLQAGFGVKPHDLRFQRI